ncbi:winged helix-turn-helix domain-containing protein [Thioclava sp. IC9]|uniref:winged helix-turn-helix domain-containing tetratricopeptide repeat protein n=1 Tax=Thioclava sp. IC9 TaxID=1973007 RepID=UPI0014126B08|nr:winged helix-turn-helix domain-containing protein [Thioclava sp. IC9]
MTATVRIGGFRFDPESGELLGHRRAVSLRPQSAKVLAVLLAARGEMVGKERLMEAVWPDTHVTDDSLVQCISEIRKALGPRDGKRLQTLPRKGYRLAVDAPVATGTRARLGALSVLAVMMVAIAAGLFFWPLTKATADPKTIAVMPFRNMSGDVDQGYFSNGVAEDLIVSLSSLSDMRVLARGTSFPLADAHRDIREVAKILKADYLLEGSVRRVDRTLRVSANLVDGRTGQNIWAERYDGSVEDLFDFQDKVLAQIMRVLSVRLSRAERERLGIRGTEDIAAYDAYLRGRELENLYSRDTNLRAEEALKSALRRDPDFALAHAHLAQVYSFRVENNWTQDRDRYIRAAFEAAEKSVTLDPKLPFAHFSLGRLYTRSFAPDLEQAILHYNEAIRLDPNYVDAYVFLANTYIFIGKAEEALPLISDAFARNPVPPFWYHLAEGMARYFLGDYDAAEIALVRARDQNPTAPFPYRFLIATYGQMGNLDEAEWMAMEYESLGRSATVSALLESASIQDAAYRARFAEGFRKAGLAEE